VNASLPSPLRHLLAGAIDYAGLFPPAALPMDRAVAGYREYLASPDRWALGRFVVPASRLAELATALAADPPGAPWRLAVTLGLDWETDAAALARAAGVAHLAPDAVEGRAPDAAAARRLAARFGEGRTVYAEVPPDHAEPVLDVLGPLGLAAKIRMGGVTPDLFPSSGAVARFLVAVAVRDLSFKATAGLHHPRRGVYPYTYAPGSPAGPMFGYLNLALAVALACAGAGAGEVEGALLEDDPASLGVTPDALVWRGHRLDAPAVDRLRRTFHGFGSCSFREPLDEAAGPVSG
jgi:hypothetical protein